MSRMRSVVLWTDNTRSRFQSPEILSTGDIGRQTWHRVIWLENRREKVAKHATGRYTLKISTDSDQIRHSDRGA